MSIITDSIASLKELTGGYSQVFMVYDVAVEEFADTIGDMLEIQGQLGISARPEDKTMDSVLKICNFLLEMEADRSCLILAVGGGTTTDMAGFAASIYKRGVCCAYIPTTLLGQVDAAIGGKTAVNFNSLKNMLGTFSEPVFICNLAEPMKTLPRRDLVSGFAELLKTFIIADASLYEQAVALLPGITESNLSELMPLIKAAVDIKCRITAQDPYEKNLRRSLNLGHTFAHAIEWLEDGSLQKHSHGEAVAIGIIAAARLSEERRVAEKGLADKLERDFRNCGLPTALPYDMAEMEAAMRNDKKVINGVIRYVLIEKIGKVLI